MTTRREAIIHALKDTLRITLIEEFGEILSARITEENMASTADAILAVRLDEAAIRKDEREKCDSYRNALLWAFDRLSVTGGLDVDTQRRTMREIGNVLTGRTSPAATYQPNDDDDSVKLTSAIRSGGKQS